MTKNLTLKQKQTHDRRLILGMFLAVAVGIPTTLLVADSAHVVTDPFLEAWHSTPAWLRQIVAEYGAWGLVAGLCLLILYLGLRIRTQWLSRPSAGIVGVRFLSAGTYARFLARVLLNGRPRDKRMFSATLILPKEQQAKAVEFKRTKPTQPRIDEATVTKGTEAEASAAYHAGAAARLYVPWVRESLKGHLGIVVPVLSLGGQTSPNVAIQLAGRLSHDGSCIPLITGHTPREITDALVDPDVYARGRAYAQEWAGASAASPSDNNAVQA